MSNHLPGNPQWRTTCSVSTCAHNVGRKGAKGLCTKHYQMLLKTGDPTGSTAPTPAQRFWVKVNKNGPTPEIAPHLGQCWVWTASKDRHGYGMFHVTHLPKKLTRRAHLWSYEQVNGPIPGGLVLDHLCRNTACVRPEHAEPVTNQENLERGWGRRIKNGMASACQYGHEYTPENTYINPLGRKICRKCRAAHQSRYQQRKAA